MIYVHRLTKESFDGNVNRWNIAEEPIVKNAIIIKVPPRLCSISCVYLIFVITEDRCIEIHEYGYSDTKMGYRRFDEVFKRCKYDWEAEKTELKIEEIKQKIPEGIYDGRELYLRLKELGIYIGTLYSCDGLNVEVIHV